MGVVIGQKFGRWEVLDLPFVKEGRTCCVCICECGRSRNVYMYALLSGATLSCGCLRDELTTIRNTHNIIGQKFGRLVVIRRDGVSKHRNIVWMCKCDCGNTVSVTGGHLLSGHTTSCGCFHKERQSECAIQNTQLGVYRVSESCTLFLNEVEKIFGIRITREYAVMQHVFDGQVGKILIEVDSVYWHRNTQKKDALKDEIALSNGFCIIRCTVNNVKDVMQQVAFYRESLEKVFRLKGII